MYNSEDKYEKKERYLWFCDSMKGLGIILLILGHLVGKENGIQQVIYSFHMPLFIIISGYLFEFLGAYNKEYHVFFLRKTKSLLTPYAKFSILMIVTAVIYISVGKGDLCYYAASKVGIARNVIDTFLGAGIGTLWFLPFLFLLESLVFFLKRNIKNKYVYILLVLGITLCGLLGVYLKENNFDVISEFSSQYYKIFYILIDDILTVFLRVGVSIPFFVVGMLLCKILEKNNKRKHTVIVFIISLCVYGLFMLKNTEMVDLYSLLLGNVFEYYIKGISGTIVIMMICYWFLNKSNFLVSIGKYSIYFMAYNTLPFIKVLSPVIKNIHQLSSHPVITNLISVIVMESLLCYVSVQIKRWKKCRCGLQE